MSLLRRRGASARNRRFRNGGAPGTARRRPAAVAIDVVVQSKRWQAVPGAARTLRAAIAAAAATVSTPRGELAIVLTDDSAIRRLNRRWRGKDAPTNVLSFPGPAVPVGAPALLGDIVIAYQTVAREALAEGKPFMHHLTHLAVHGFLHLIGYDHAAEKEAQAMEALETAILAGLDVPDPYRARAGNR
jgi:probable rRNA maturation factor